MITKEKTVLPITLQTLMSAMDDASPIIVNYLDVVRVQHSSEG
jgi:hypothetical protein